MKMKKKYVKLSYVGFFLFSEEVPHLHIEHIAEQGGYAVISAGFWEIGDSGLADCFGESIGLGVSSLPGDSDELRAFLGQTDQG